MESHVDISKVLDVWKKLCNSWDWLSNANVCTKGTRIILGWNIEIVDVMLLAQTDQVFNTWTQKPKKGVGLLKKIDRVSDHSPCVLQLLSISPDQPKPFKFANFLADKEGFRDLVANAWQDDIGGHNMFKVVKKLRSLKRPLRKILFQQGNLHARVDQCRADLDEIQAEIDKDPTNSGLREKETIVLKKFNDASYDEECFLKQKSKVEWLKCGDSNSKFFHNSVKSKNHRSRIEVIKDVNGVIHEGKAAALALVAHYENFLGSRGDMSPFMHDGLFSRIIDTQQANDMIRTVSQEEIKKAMFSIGDNKAPGPDGFSSAFFKKTWDCR
uniref:uncharacterized protein LOC122584908 n=1 Tax=Erigeron canadensis TaxID=72917 RepID=UPI001CB8E328|nr:uncharacterized protein LOC122584908 [Erigeron canadensis]